MGLVIDGTGISYLGHQREGTETNLACAIHIVLSSSILVRRYTGILTYTADNIGRISQAANVELRASFFPGRFAAIVEDVRAIRPHVGKPPA